MHDLPPSISSLQLFSLSELQKYLRSQGWTQGQTRKSTSEYTQFFPRYDQMVRLLVPQAETSLDYFERINDVLSTLTSLANKTFQDVISEVVQFSNDILRMRIETNRNYTRSIPLDIAAEEVDALKRLFVYGASSEEKPRPFFDKATTIGVNHGNHCHFGHTFQGSFGFTVNSPILDDFTQLSFEAEPVRVPFERKVVERLAIGFANTEEATRTGNPDIIVENFETGLNSRMCDALVDLSQKSNNVLNFQIQWSPQVPVAPVPGGLATIRMKPESIEIVADAAKRLKTVEPFQDVIIGKIVTLHANKSPFSDEEFPRIAIVKHFYQDRPIEAKLELTMEQYKEAYEAHGAGATIRAFGMLYRKGNSWRMVEVSRIERFHS